MKMGTKSILLLLLASFLVAVNAAPMNSKTYIVHMEKNISHEDITAKGAWYSELMQGVKMLLSEEEEDDGRECLHHVFDRVFNGFSARLTPEQASYIEKLPGVLGLYPNRIHKTSTTHSPEFLGLTGTNARLWNESRYGEDVIIGVIDSGIWPERPSFSDEFLGPIPQRWNGTCEAGVAFNTSHCNNKIIGARYFYLGNEAAYGPINETNEYKSPRDYNGHGTHCASTAAGRRLYPAFAFDGLARGSATGMAPKARIAVYKALWRGSGEGVTDDVVAAIDQAVIDGVDVISFSISGFGQLAPLHSDPFSIAAYNAMKQGIFFSAAAGNAGPAPFTIDHAAPWVTTVAATTQDREIDASVELGNGSRLSGRSTFDGKGLNGNISLPLIYAGDAALNPSLRWNASVCEVAALLNASLVQGKLILCDSDPVTSVNDILDVAGAAGMILANTLADGEALKLPGSFGATPFTQVGYAARQNIISYIRSTPAPMARILPARTVLGVKPAPEVAGFSSRGPIVYDGVWLKPDIAAPGVDILAAGIREEIYAFMSGTSMACPHISGIAALLKSVHPNWSPAAIRSALMTTATTLDNTRNTMTAEETGRAASPWEFGAGLTQPERAMNPGLVYDMGPQDYFFFLCALGYTTEQIQIFEHGPFTCPPRVRIEDTNFPSFVAVFDNQTVLNKTPLNYTRTLTSVTSGGGTYNASVEQPQGFSVIIEPSTLTFSPQELLRSFTLTVTPLGTVTNTPSYGAPGSIVWSDGLHVVRSPLIVVIANL